MVKHIIASWAAGLDLPVLWNQSFASLKTKNVCVVNKINSILIKLFVHYSKTKVVGRFLSFYLLWHGHLAG